MIGSVWREPQRWIRLIDLIIGQFTAVGLALGVLGLARLSRWHPPVGVVTMIAFGTYATFGLIYYGADSPVLMLPLLMIQLLWMTYAVYTFGQWLQKSARPAHVCAGSQQRHLPCFHCSCCYELLGWCSAVCRSIIVYEWLEILRESG